MSLGQQITVDRETAVAVGVLWLLGFVCALAFSVDTVPALFWSALGAFILSLSYVIGDEEGRRMVANPTKAFGFFVLAMLFALLSFGGDCLFGWLNYPDEKIITACTEKAGIGFAFTILCVTMAIGVPLMGFVRWVVATMWKRNG